MITSTSISTAFGKGVLDISLPHPEDQLIALSRLKEISDLIVSLRENVKEYPANGTMIQRLQQERLQLMKHFIRLVPLADCISLPSSHD